MTDSTVNQAGWNSFEESASARLHRQIAETKQRDRERAIAQRKEWERETAELNAAAEIHGPKFKRGAPGDVRAINNTGPARLREGASNNRPVPYGYKDPSDMDEDELAEFKAKVDAMAKLVDGYARNSVVE